jgi:hypothetical protein
MSSRYVITLKQESYPEGGYRYVGTIAARGNVGILPIIERKAFIAVCHKKGSYVGSFVEWRLLKRAISDGVCAEWSRSERTAITKAIWKVENGYEVRS